MIDRALGLGAPKRQSYYFVLLVNSIKANQSNAEKDATHVKFAVFKGPQIFNQMKDPQPLNWENNSASIHKCQLAFFLPVYDAHRKINFTIKMIGIKDDTETEIGQYVVTSNDYVDSFLNENNNQVAVTAEFGSYSVDFFIFTQRTRFAVDKIVKQYKLTIPTDHHYDQRKSNRMSETHNKPRSFIGSDRLGQSRKSQPGVKLASTQRLAEKETINQKKQEEQPKKVVVTQEKESEPELKLEPQPEVVAEPEADKIPQPKQENTRQKTRPARISHLQKEQEKITPYPQQKIVTNKENPAEQVKAPEIGPDLQRRMKASGRLTSSIRLKPVEETPKKNENPLNWKMILFLIVSLFLTYQAMAPSRKVPYKNSRR